jgi:hypothetical protein
MLTFRQRNTGMETISNHKRTTDLRPRYSGSWMGAEHEYDYDITLNIEVNEESITKHHYLASIDVHSAVAYGECEDGWPTERDCSGDLDNDHELIRHLWRQWQIDNL